MFNLNILEHCSVRLHGSCGTDLGRSIKMATDNIQTIGLWLNRFTRSQPSHWPQKPCNQKDTRLKICK